MNPLRDYAENFWDRSNHSRPQMEAMVREVAAQYFDEASVVELDSVFGQDLGKEFVTALRDVTGHDGVVVDFGPGKGKHYVAWFADQMKLTSNESPDESNRL